MRERLERRRNLKGYSVKTWGVLELLLKYYRGGSLEAVKPEMEILGKFLFLA